MADESMTAHLADVFWFISLSVIIPVSVAVVDSE
jgi:hypothetical protein